MTGADDVPPDPAPMVQDHPPGSCPHCGAAWLTIGRRSAVDDAGVCQHCASLVIADGAGWRQPTFDERLVWEADPRVQFMQANARAAMGPLPGPGPEGEDL